MECQQEERHFEDEIPYSAVTSPGERIMTQIAILTQQVTQLRQEASLKRLPVSEACNEWVFRCLNLNTAGGVPQETTCLRGLWWVSI